MNFLAHFYLSGNDEGLLVGNFIADGVKGAAYTGYPANVQRGILMHRAIDHFTDTHEVNAKARALIHSSFHHYSGVVLDVYYDHFLAKYWNEFSAEPLSLYSQRVYSFLAQHLNEFPERPRHMFPYMREHDWLMAYPHIEGVDRVMKGMARRVKFNSGMEHSAEVLVKHYAALEMCFREFFPLLQEHTAHFRSGGE